MPARQAQLHNTFCPECSEKVYRRSSARGKIRYHHRRAQNLKCKWWGTDAVGAEIEQKTGVDLQRSRELKQQIIRNRGKRVTYVITSAQNATPVHEKGWQSLQTYCKRNRAQLLVIPYRYKNPTSMWTAKAQKDDWWAAEVRPYLITHRVDINQNLVLLADIMTQPTGERPLLGFETITGHKSGIIGHPKLELQTVPTPQAKLSKIITTTGSITKKNYIPGKAGKKGEFHHTFGATVVEVRGKLFYMRQLNILRDGSFCDLVHEYDGRRVRKYDRVPALVMGDTHVEVVDPAVVRATFVDKNSMVKTLRPEKLVWHDVFDGAAKNYWDRSKPFVQYVKHKAGKDDVKAELKRTLGFIDHHAPPNTLNIFVPSNHNDRVLDWLQHNDWRWDPVNFDFGCEMAGMVLRSPNTKWTRSGPIVADAFALWAKKHLKTESVLFLKRGDSYVIKDIEIAFHGDRGPGGADGARSSFRKIGVRSIIGHSHAPGIMEGAYQVGTSSMLDLHYNEGCPSSWLQGHAVIYPNGKRALLMIIMGKWRP